MAVAQMLLCLAVLCVYTQHAAAVLASTNGTIGISYEEANGNAPRGGQDLSLQSLARSVYGA